MREEKMEKKWKEMLSAIIFILIGIVVFIMGFFYVIVEPAYLRGRWALFGTGIFWICMGAIYLYLILKETEIPKWIQKKLSNEEVVIDRFGFWFATNKRLIGSNRIEFRSLEYDKISDITYEKYGLKMTVGRGILLSLGILLYIIGIIASMEWETYIFGHRTVNYPQPQFFIIGLIGGSLSILIAFSSSKYFYQIKNIDFNKKQSKLWQIKVPYRNREKFKRFINIIKEKIGKNI
jgi:hypothetical protein